MVETSMPSANFAVGVPSLNLYFELAEGLTAETLLLATFLIESFTRFCSSE